MKLTTNKVILAIEKGDSKMFADLIGTDKKDDAELLAADVKKIKVYLDKYQTARVPVITDKFTSLGKRLVIVPIFRGNDTINGIKEIDLNLFFGPPDMVALKKITGYSLKIIDLSGKNSRRFLPTTFND